VRCPKCGHLESKVIDSRTLREGDAIRRRRECESCSLRFTTYERLEEPLMVVKKDHSREAFDRSKVMHGIRLACKKRKIPDSTVKGLVERVSQQMYSRGVREVDTEEIGKAVADGLRLIDDVAFVRFMSVYQQFEDTGEFRKALDQLAPEEDG